MGTCQACGQHCDRQGQAEAALEAEQPTLGVLEGDVCLGALHLLRGAWQHDVYV